MTWRTLSARALLGAVLFLALGGPAPGAVGSCTDSSVTCSRFSTATFPGPPDGPAGGCWAAFCTARLHAVCDRNRLGATSDTPVEPECAPNPLSADATEAAAQLATESNNIDRTCQSSGSPFGVCADPSDLAAQACVDALYDRDNYPQAPDDVDACANVRKCGGS